MWWVVGGVAFVMLSLIGYATSDHWPTRLGPHGDRNDFGER